MRPPTTLLLLSPLLLPLPPLPHRLILQPNLRCRFYLFCRRPLQVCRSIRRAYTYSSHAHLHYVLGVPEEDIPDWLLGAGEDPHATLGLSRAPTPEPPSPVNVRPEPSRPKLQKIPGESFPALIPPPVHEPAATSVANGPVIRPKRMGWTVLPEASAPTDSNKASRSSGQNRKKGYYGKRK